MDIFIVINSDDTVQVGDMVRFDLTKSFVSKPKITAADVAKIEVSPKNDGVWYEIHDSSVPAEKAAVKDWFFDWLYVDKTGAVSDTMTVGFRFTGSDASVVTKTKSFTILTAAQDNLFSSDNDLIAHEPDIMKWLPDGRSSWNYVHRRVQSRVLSYLFENKYKNTDGSPYTKSQVLEKYDVKEWSTFMALKIIFGSVIKSKDDVFLQKAKFYENLEGKALNTDIRIDKNSDGIQSSSEVLDISSATLVRR